MTKQQRCAICGIEIDETSFYDDTCNECAVREGLLNEGDVE